MQRIVVFGFAGSGKSTLARAVAQRIGLVYFEMDGLHWNPGWVETPTPEFRQKVDALTVKGGWITEGNYAKVRDIYLSRADTVIWLDYPFWFSFMRLLKRTLGRIMFRRAICNGNYETLQGAFFSKDSLLLFVLKLKWRMWRNHEDYSVRWQDYPHLEVLRFTSPRQTQNWLDSLE